MKSYKRIKILTKVPQVMRNEIDSYMNFDSLLEEFEKTKAINKKRKIRNTLIPIFIVAVSVSFYYIFNQKVEIKESNFQPENSSSTQIQITDTLNDQLSKENGGFKNKADIHLNNIKFDSLETKQSKTKLQKSKITKSLKGKIKGVETITSKPSQLEYTYNAALPLYGYEKLYVYFKENLTYPDELRKDSIEGIVLISFLVLKDSSISNIEIMQSLGERFDNEAIRVIGSMPKWIPATVNDDPVSSKLSIPLSFSIVNPSTIID